MVYLLGVWGMSGRNLRYTKEVLGVYQTGIYGCQVGVRDILSVGLSM